VEFFEVRFELRLVGPEALDLFGVMFIDHVFDRDGASHRRLFAHQRVAAPSAKACCTPNRFQSGCRTARVLHHAVERIEMFLFLGGHAADRQHILDGANLAPTPQAGFIDAKRADSPA